MDTSYGAPFLDEALAGGMPFLPTGIDPPKVASIKISGAFQSCNVVLRGITVRPTQTQLAQFDCTIECGGEIVAAPADFVVYDGSQFDTTYILEEIIVGYVHGTMAVPAMDVYLTYVMLNGQTYNSDPSVTFQLAPCCLELEAGYVAPVIDINPTVPMYGALTLKSGYNYVLTPSSTSLQPALTFSVETGAGLGLVPCNGSGAGEPSVLRTLSGVPGDERGNILLQPPSGDCIAVDSDPGINSIALDAHCAPCCRCSDYSDVSEYARGFALDYHSSAVKYNTVAKSYNSVAQRFAARQACCQNMDKLNPRFRFWPQQNFKLQIQAMVENNTDTPIRIDNLSLEARFRTATAISATETVDGESLTYSMTGGQPLAVLPMPDASYLYFKNLNPSSKGIEFSSSQQGLLTTLADFTNQGDLAGCSATGESPNHMAPCSGYSMITAGAMIVDPIFRKIVNLKEEDVELSVDLTLKYLGTEPGQCPNTSPVADRTITVETRSVKLGPNRQSVNPCPPLKGSYVSYANGGLKMKLNGPGSGSGTVKVTYRQLIGGEWVSLFSSNAAFSASNQNEISLGNIPEGYSGTYQAVVEYSSGGGLTSKCQAVDGANDEGQDIPSLPFKISSTFTT